MGPRQDEKACFSRINYKSSKDIPISLQDNQDLQLLRQKLLRTSAVLVSCLEVIRGCKLHYRKLVTLNVVDEDEQLLAEIEVYIRQIQHHRVDISRILEYSSGTSKLVGNSCSRIRELCPITERSLAFRNSGTPRQQFPTRSHPGYATQLGHIATHRFSDLSRKHDTDRTCTTRPERFKNAQDP
jgi:hypothetical protein